VPKQDIAAVIATSGLSLPSPTSTTSETDDFVLALAKWFKSDYMSWVDPIRCPVCDGPTQAAESVAPTPAERTEGGGRVELHRCSLEPACEGVRRFVRYGQIGPLLRSREGRCGEWAHLFYAFLRVAGVEARYIWNR
jgi:peptide-N4-(N-acetyl-beta-glucosaminyl)asparagine amidase